jgi:hypothetical protein
MKKSVFNLITSASLISVVLAGCATSTALFREPSLLVRDPGSLVGRPKVEKNVAKIVALWEPTTGKGLDNLNARGFTGQILFFGSGCETGARVHGKVNIYEYDNFNPDSLDEPELLHTFSFEPEAWDAHHSEGTFGHSYCVFVPYVQKHRDQVHCGLRVEIVLEDGRTVTTRPTDVLLSGKHGTSDTAGPTRGFVRNTQIKSDVEAMTGQPYFGEPHTMSVKQERAPRKLDTLSIPLPKH